MFRDYLTKLNVAWYDVCCPEAGLPALPLRFNSEASSGNEIEYFNGAGWVTYPIPTEIDFLSELQTFLPQYISGNGLSGEDGQNFALFSNGNAPEDITGSGVANTETFLTNWTTGAPGDTLSFGDALVTGQLKKVIMVADGGDGTITPDSVGVSFSSVTLTAVGQYVVFIWGGAAWGVWDYFGATINP
jgi:hypothetical protein